jgi:hypothetical protein
MKTLRVFLTLSVLAAVSQINGAALACAACYGQSDSPMAQGMNAGIFALLAVVGVIWCGAATFFVFLARRAATTKLEQKPKL